MSPGSSNRIIVEQHRFLSSGDVQQLDDESIWHVPLNIVIGSLQSDLAPMAPPLTLESRRQEFDIPIDKSAIFKLNGKQTGFYRVSYSAEMMGLLGDAVAAGRLSPSDRLGILNDAFNLAFSIQGSTVSALELLEKYANEDDLIIWIEISTQLGKLKSILFEHDESIRASLSSITQKLFSPIVEKLGWEFPTIESEEKSSLLRALAISLAGSNGDKRVLSEARRRFKLFTEENDMDALHPNIRGPVFSMMVRFGGVEEYEKVYQIYQESVDVADAKVIALSALTASRDPELINRTLLMSLDRSIVKSQDVIYIFRNIVGNEAARRVTWKFVKKHWSPLYNEFYCGSLSLLSSIISASTGSLTLIDDVIDVKKFFENKKEDISAAARTIEQSLEKIKNMAQWIEKESASVEEWLKICAGSNK